MPLVVFLALGGYGFGAWRFWKGYHKTNFQQKRLMLTLLWPVLLTNRSYRQNFSKALKG